MAQNIAWMLGVTLKAASLALAFAAICVPAALLMSSANAKTLPFFADYLVCFSPLLVLRFAPESSLGNFAVSTASVAKSMKWSKFSLRWKRRLP